MRATDPVVAVPQQRPWRPNPPIDDGHYITTGAQVDFDTRNERYLPSTGWLLRARFEHSSTGDVTPVELPELVRPAGPARAPLRVRPAAPRLPPLHSASRPTCG